MFIIKLINYNIKVKYKNIKFKQMLFLLIIILFISISQSQLTLENFQPLDKTINAITSYNWTMSFTASTSHTNVELSFPSRVNLTAPINITYNGVNITGVSINGSKLIFTYPPAANNQTIVTFIVNGVKNPSSAILSSDFLLKVDSVTVGPKTNFDFVQYRSGTLSGCTFTFGGTTQQKNTTLNIILTTTNPLETGNNKLKVIFTPWNQLSTSSLATASNLTCSISFNNGVNYTNSSCIVIQNITKTIEIPFTLSTVINASSILVKIDGVNNPPAVNLINQTLYIITLDGLNNVIDAPLNNTCIINSVTVTSFQGIFQSTQIINRIYSVPTIVFSFNKSTSILLNDVLQFTYFTGLDSCNGNIQVQRDGITRQFISYTLSSSLTNKRSYIADVTSPASASPLVVQLDCNIIMPPSEQPVVYTFQFKRNNILYMQLTAQLDATAAPLQTVTFTPSTSQILSLADYTFRIPIKQELTASPKVQIDMPNGVNISQFNNTCSATVNLTSNAAITCKVIDITNKIFQLNLTSISRIYVNSTIQITISSIRNTNNPNLNTFGLKTFYNSALNLSVVQKNTNALTFAFTVHIINGTLNPSSFKVYSLNQFTITFVNMIDYPANSNYVFTFPTQLKQIIFKTMTLNGTLLSINANIINNTVTLTYGSIVNANGIFVITFSARMPASIGLLSSITMIVSNSILNYEKITIGMQINVNISSVGQFQITPQPPKTGTVAFYEIRLITQIPHPSQYYLDIVLPDNLSFIFANSTCVGSCKPNVSLLVNSTIRVIGNNNTYNNSSGYYLFEIHSFKNLRSVSSSLPYLFSTKTINEFGIINGSASVSITSPSLLTGILSLEDDYYRNKNATINLDLTFTNNIISTDIIQLQIPANAYLIDPNANLTCHTMNCSINASASNPLSLTVLLIYPNLNASGLNLKIYGFISAPNTLYSDSINIKVTSKTVNQQLIDVGNIRYNISCNQNLSVFTCKQCYNNGQCISCYTEDNRFFDNGLCTNNCSNPSSFQRYGTNGTCIQCQRNCSTCFDQFRCISCLPNNYYLYPNLTCLDRCEIVNGYYIVVYFSITNCLRCSDPNCQKCTNNICERCFSGSVLEGGICSNGCSSNNTIIVNGGCSVCDISCRNGCTAIGSDNCNQCNFSGGYYNYSGICTYGCPSGTVNINILSCGCLGNCISCIDEPTYCKTCIIPSNGSILYAYNGQCISSCPNFTYPKGSSCVSCNVGCISCNDKTCLQCNTDLYLYQNKCYSDCNLINQQFDNFSSKCVQCPSGCDTCLGIICYLCLDNYTLVNSNCKLTCQVNNNCTPPQIVPDRILPVSGSIACVLWLVIVVCMKFFVVTGSYIPYSFIFLGSVTQIILTYVILILVATSSIQSGRLLQLTTSHYAVVIPLLITAIILNYLMNFIYIYIFCKYVHPLISNQQIDKISNYTVLGLGVITNFRFHLIAYSKLFPKPSIPIKNHTKLTPVHYVCIVSIILSVFPIAVSGLMIYNEYPLTDKFMAGIDLLIVTILNVVFSLWFVAINKSDEYYDMQQKRYNIQQIYRTQDNLNEQSKQKDISKISFNLKRQDDKQNDQFQQQFNEKYYKFDNKVGNSRNNPSDGQNIPLPFKPSILTTIPLKIQSKSDIESSLKQQSIITKPRKNNRYKKSEDEGLQNKKYQSTHNYSKPIKKVDKMDLKIKKEKYLDKNIIQSHKKESQDIEDVPDYNHHFEDDSIPQKLKPSTQRSQIVQIRQKLFDNDNRSDAPPMKKKTKIGVFQSDYGAQSNIDQIDLEAIIKSKIVENKNDGTKTEKLERENPLNEQISPSWFNIQNQRFDFQQFQSND